MVDLKCQPFSYRQMLASNLHRNQQVSDALVDLKCQPFSYRQMLVKKLMHQKSYVIAMVEISGDEIGDKCNGGWKLSRYNNIE